MTVKRHIFDVEYLDTPTADPRVFRTRVVSVDKYKVERDGHQYGILDPAAQPQAVGLLWLYFSARREGHVDESTTFEEFLERCLDNALVSGEGEAVDPTRPGVSGEPLSPSPEPFPASPMPSGSTPTTD